jgi:hypothetical protein
MDQGKAQSGAYNIVVYASPDKTTTIQRITDPSSFLIIKRSGGFTSIQLLDGREGYIESRFLEFPLELLELKQDQVPMYPSASVKPGPKATLVQGVLIECIGDVVEADGIRWLPIKSPHGQTGYIRDDTKRAPPSRFYYFRMVPRIYLIKVFGGIGLFLLELLKMDL